MVLSNVNTIVFIMVLLNVNTIVFIMVLLNVWCKNIWLIDLYINFKYYNS